MRVCGLHADAGFYGPFWRWFFLSAVGGFAVYRLTSTGKNGEKSSIAEFIEHYSVPTEQTRAQSQEHLDFVLKKSEAQMLVNDAQKPEAHRMIFLPCVLRAVCADAVPLTSTRAAAFRSAAWLTPTI